MVNWLPVHRLRNDAILKSQAGKAAEEHRTSLVQRLQAQIVGFFGLATLEERFKTAGFKSKYYTPAIHKAAFALPAWMNDALKK